jgi:hypothetical protein
LHDNILYVSSSSLVIVFFGVYLIVFFKVYISFIHFFLRK